MAAALLAISLFATACGSDADTAAAPASDTEADQAVETAADEAAEPASEDEETSAEPAALDPSDTEPADEDAGPPPISGGVLAEGTDRTNWVATIDGRIGASVWLAQQDDFLRGQITYDNVGEPIDLVGQAYASGQGYFLREFSPDGDVTGTLILGNVDDGVVSDASWSADGRDLSLEFVLDDVIDDAYTFDPLVRPGRYEFAFAPFAGAETCCGPEGLLSISDVGESEATIAFDNHAGAPGYNLALVDPITAPKDGNVISVDGLPGGLDCAFTTTVFDGFAFVQMVDDRYDCGFGNAASVEGMYVLTEQFVSVDESPFAEAALSPTSFGPIAIGDSWQSLVDRFGAEPYSEENDFFGGCHYTSIPNDPLAPIVMLIGEGADATVARIELVHPSHQTIDGLRVGDTELDVQKLYPDLDESPHVYLSDGAKYLFVEPPDGAESTILFETDTTGTIIAARSGLLDPVRYVEGCA